MKTTLDIEPELYAAAERLAQSQKKSLGQVVSELLRRALGLSTAPDDGLATELERRNGFDVFPERAGPKATVETVQQLCREEGI
jgi:negative regulator of replication initiation